MEGLSTQVYRHPTVHLYGDITIGKGSSLWVNAVIRAEINRVIIGDYTNIQDFVMIHVGDRTDTIIGDYCSIAHRAVIHGARIGNNCLIGVGAIVMDGCEIGDNSIIDSAAYLPPGTKIPANSIVKGNPGEITKSRNNFIANRMNAIYYCINAEHYQQNHFRAWSDPGMKSKSKAFYKMLQAIAG